MKKDIVPTNEEQVMHEHDFIVSKTDTKGRLVYCNRIFIEYSGYTEEELIGKQHNVVRHPDMPRSAFALLWSTIKGGDEFFAYVKNMRKDGGFYWVLANVTPSYDESHNIVGYFSVRRKPLPEKVRVIEALYAQMLAAEKQAGASGAVAAGTEVLLDVINGTGKSYREFILSI